MYLMSPLVPAAVMDRDMHGHDVSSPQRPKKVAPHACAVEASQGADEPDLVLTQDAGRIARE